MDVARALRLLLIIAQRAGFLLPPHPEKKNTELSVRQTKESLKWILIWSSLLWEINVVKVFYLGQRPTGSEINFIIQQLTY